MTAEQLALHCIAVPAEVADQIRLFTSGSTEWCLSWSFTHADLPQCDALVVPAEMLPELRGFSPAVTHSTRVVAFGPADLLPFSLMLGASDYLKTPWDAEELFARLKRRFADLTDAIALPGLSLVRGRLVTETAVLPLSAAEVRIMRLLLRFTGEVVSRRALYFAIWGREGGTSRVVDVHISGLRRKLQAVDCGCGSFRIRAVRGEGYTLDDVRKVVDKL